MHAPTISTCIPGHFLQPLMRLSVNSAVQLILCACTCTCTSKPLFMYNVHVRKTYHELNCFSITEYASGFYCMPSAAAHSKEAEVREMDLIGALVKVLR